MEAFGAEALGIQSLAVWAVLYIWYSIPPIGQKSSKNHNVKLY
jgi:hypothetical protein